MLQCGVVKTGKVITAGHSIRAVHTVLYDADINHTVSQLNTKLLLNYRIQTTKILWSKTFHF